MQNATNPGLMIAIPCRDQISSAVFGDLLGCLIHAAGYWQRRFGNAPVTYSVHRRVHIVEARNMMAEEALEAGVEWVLWLDDDMAPPQDLLERLHGAGKDLVGAVAYKRAPPYPPCVYRIVDEKPVAFDPDPTKSLLKADLTGFACILTHSRVLKAVWDATDGRPFQLRGGIGEDIFFCLHARKLGIQLHIVPDLVVGHLTEMVIGREQRESCLRAEEMFQAE